MRIGIKLTLGFDRDPAYQALSSHSDFLSDLTSLGVECTETAIGPDTEEQQLRSHTDRCIEAGLCLSLHPYSERTPANPAHFEERGTNACMELHRRFLTLASGLARRQGLPVVVNIHPAADHGDPMERSALVEQSVAFFEWCRHYTEMLEGTVLPVAELQIAPSAEERFIRVGDRFDEAEAIARRAGVGVCWDFGHSYLNCLRNHTDDRPPPSFTETVTHVHCHDVLRHDHEPLLFGTVPWQAYLRLLGEADFNGIVVLEVPAQGFLQRGARSALVHSIDALRAMGRELG
jgi:sugar phosphate isomerase/epimerase